MAPRPAVSGKRIIHQLDAAELPVGRLATRAARLLLGKHKVTYVPNRDVGDFVTVVNGRSLRFSGKKMRQKIYYRASGYGGGVSRHSAQELARSRRETILRHAIAHMLPDNRLRSARLRRLKIIP